MKPAKQILKTLPLLGIFLGMLLSSFFGGKNKMCSNRAKLPIIVHKFNNIG